MKLLEFAGDSPHRTGTLTLGTADTRIRNGQREKFAAGTGRALLIPDVGNVFIPEITQRAQDRIRGGSVYSPRIISPSIFSSSAMTIRTAASKSNSVEMQLVAWA